jgi:hypothetical protein
MSSSDLFVAHISTEKNNLLIEQPPPLNTINQSIFKIRSYEPPPPKTKKEKKEKKVVAPKQLSTSCYLGVSKCTKEERWQARIRIKNAIKYLGRFKKEEEAAMRYDQAARLYHGNRATLNFPTDEDISLGRKSAYIRTSRKKLKELE